MLKSQICFFTEKEDFSLPKEEKVQQESKKSEGTHDVKIELDASAIDQTSMVDEVKKLDEVERLIQWCFLWLKTSLY